MALLASTTSAKIEKVQVSAYTVPTDFPESDGTIAWDKTTLVLVEVFGGGQKGIGYSYADSATAVLIRDLLCNKILGEEALDVAACWAAMVHSIRNLGRPGIASMAIATVDIALWDLKAKLLNISLSGLLGGVRREVAAYGSGGFTSYTREQLQSQLSGWVRSGIKMVKMKVGRDPDADLERVRQAREAIGADAQLFVDANGAYSRKQALWFAERFTDYGVTWFEEPVTSDDLEGMRLVRDRAPVGMDIAAGEYGYDSWYFRRMLDAGAVDVLQIDGTRCAGITGFLKASALCLAHTLPMSAHTSPTIHGQVCCAVPGARHVEYFHDHARIERMFFDGALEPIDGKLRPDRSRPGLGLELKTSEMQKYAIT